MIRLTVVLALVMVVMQQASQPEMYETFFGSGDETDVILVNDGSLLRPPDGSKVGGSEMGGSKAGVTGEPIRIPADSITPETRMAAAAIARDMKLNEQRQWTVILDAWQSGKAFDLMRTVIPATISTVDQVDGLTAQQRSAWTSTLEAFGTQYANVDLVVAAPSTSRDGAEDPESIGSPDLTDDDAKRLSAWLNALDQAAVDRVEDGAIWLSQDFDAFYRQLSQTHKLDPRGAVSVSVVPLMQQPQVYLGQKVRVSGRVARALKKAAAANPYGVQHYWELWIRPSDGGDRPIVLIVPNVSQRIADIGSDAADSRGPEVRVVGRFFKRLAYGSSLGADAAPVVVGRILVRQRSAVAAGAAGATGDGIAAPARLWLAVTVALLAGVTFAALVMWRTAVLSKRSREVRGANRPSTDGLFDTLADHEPSANSIVKK